VYTGAVPALSVEPTAPSVPSRMRSFDPLRLGGLERAAWMAYYRRESLRFVTSALGMVREGFGMSWPRTVLGAYLVLRANQQWAPVPDNDPHGAWRSMRRFYALVARAHGEGFDPAKAAALEVEWWRVHRHLQRDPRSGDDQTPLVDALAALYGYVYQVPDEAVRAAARFRAEAMRISDAWVAAGCAADSPLVATERAALVRSYAALLAAVHRGPSC
jgi:hypothetical protein